MTNLIDKIFLIRVGIKTEHKIRRGLSVFETRDTDEPWVLKFSYPGDIQYQKITRTDAARLTEILNTSCEEEGEK